MKLLAQIVVGGEVLTEIMTQDQAQKMLEMNLSADYIDEVHFWDASEIGEVRPVEILDVWPVPEFSGIASLNDSDYYAGRE